MRSISRYRTRRTTEAIHIRLSKGTMNLDSNLQLPTIWNPILNPTWTPPCPPRFCYIVIIIVIVIYYIIIFIDLTYCILKFSFLSSSPVKNTRLLSLVAVFKSSHSCNSFSFVADENLRGRNVLLSTSLSFCYENCSSNFINSFFINIVTTLLWVTTNSGHTQSPHTCAHSLVINSNNRHTERRYSSHQLPWVS